MSRRGAFIAVTIILTILNVWVWWGIIFPEVGNLKVSFLNVGQGDAVLIQSPTGVEVLIDGGRDRSVLRELPKLMGPLDRSIDVVIATHPDADHIGGLIGVFANYRISAFIDSGVTNDTNTTYAVLDAVAHEKDIRTVRARRGERITIGGGAYVDILFPDRDVKDVETNTGSIVARVVYGNTSFLLSGDSPSAIENWLVELDGTGLKSDVLKAGHHGSRTSTSDAWLAASNPGIVVISAGKDNSYGHPHQEVLERVAASGAPIVSTANGAVVFASDGRRVIQKK